jgi:hypothetical protein
VATTAAARSAPTTRSNASIAAWSSSQTANDDIARLYTGVGSRETPPDILDLMTRLAQRLAAIGWVCRTGGALGADAVQRASCNASYFSGGTGLGSAARVLLTPNWLSPDESCMRGLHHRIHRLRWGIGRIDRSGGSHNSSVVDGARGRLLALSIIRAPVGWGS